MNAPTAHTLREAGKQDDRRRWEDRRLQDRLDKIKTAYTACAWDIGSAFKGALPASVKALHSAIYPDGMPPEAKAQAVGTGMQQDSDKAEVARLRAEREEHACSHAIDGAGNIYRRYREPRCFASAIPAERHTDKWESSRIADYNMGWNACRAEALASIKQEGKA